MICTAGCGRKSGNRHDAMASRRELFGAPEIRYADGVADVWLTEVFIRIRHDMGRVDQAGFPKP